MKAWLLLAAVVSTLQPYRGITILHRTETEPRPVSIHVVRIDLTAAGLRFKLTPPNPASSRETIRQTTAAFLAAEQAQLAVNAHFFVPFPSPDLHSDLVGLAASEGRVYSAFEAPTQDYAIAGFAPAINLGRDNRARLVHHDAGVAGGKGIQESVELWNAISGSAQVVTSGSVTVPEYRDAGRPLALLNPGGPGQYANGKSWYDVPNARTLAGIDKEGRTLTIMVVDRLKVGEAAELLVRDYGVHDALNLDGGGSTTLALRDPDSGEVRILNKPTGGTPRAVASSLAVFAAR